MIYGDHMANQIESTPVVKGKDAIKIYKQANQPRSEKYTQNAEIIKEEILSKLSTWF